MARWKPNCLITKSFAFGSPAKQYKKGKEMYLNDEVKEFAALNRCAVMLDKAEKEEKSGFFSKSSEAASLEGDAP